MARGKARFKTEIVFITRQIILAHVSTAGCTSLPNFFLDMGTDTWCTVGQMSAAGLAWQERDPAVECRAVSWDSHSRVRGGRDTVRKGRVKEGRGRSLCSTAAQQGGII